MREHEVNKLNNFICGYYTDNISVCDDLIEYHKQSENKFAGTISTGMVKSFVKNSIDVRVGEDQFKNYCMNILIPAQKEYTKKYPYTNYYGPWEVTEGANIQHYKPHGAFHAWHTERGNNITPYNNRHLVFMTYLNDVTDAGETEFFHQELKIKPEKGLTVIWPADWTFTHRGVPSPTQEKYIITGWYSFR